MRVCHEGLRKKERSAKLRPGGGGVVLALSGKVVSRRHTARCVLGDSPLREARRLDASWNLG